MRCVLYTQYTTYSIQYTLCTIQYTVYNVLVYYIYTVVAHMLVTARKNYSMNYAYAVYFIECIDTQN